MTSANGSPDEVDVVAGREPPPFAQAPVWVHLAPVSAKAKELHTILLAHVNQIRAQGGDRRVFPTTRALARILGYKDPAAIGPLSTELVKIGALDKQRFGMPSRNRYVVHSMPPDGYTGPMSLADWYAQNKPSLAAEAEAEADRRRAKRAVGPAQDKPVAAKERQLDPEPPVAAENRQQVAAPERQHVAAENPRELYEEELDEENYKIKTPDSRNPDDPVDSATPGQTTPPAGEGTWQGTIDGGEKRVDPPPDPRDVAYGIARIWVEFWAEKGTPIGGRKPITVMQNLVVGFLAQGYAQEEIEHVLKKLKKPIIPSISMMQDALVNVRLGKPAVPRQGRAPVENVNAHWRSDDQTSRPRRAELPDAVVQTTGGAW